MGNQNIICSEKCKVKITYNHKALVKTQNKFHKICKNPKQMKQPRQDKHVYIYISPFL
jgi:hypothetical protein